MVAVVRLGPLWLDVFLILPYGCCFQLGIQWRRAADRGTGLPVCAWDGHRAGVLTFHGPEATVRPVKEGQCVFTNSNATATLASLSWKRQLHAESQADGWHSLPTRACPQKPSSPVIRPGVPG